MKNNPLISVIIPTFNGEKYLEGALQSVFRQTYQQFEIIVVDDGSLTDASAKICDKFRERLTYFLQENKGLSAARNAGIRRSRGDYIAFIDDDDIWLPEKLEKLVRYDDALRTKGITSGLIYSGYQAMLENGEDLCKVLYRVEGPCYLPLLFVNLVGPPSAVLISRSVLDQVGLFDENLRAAEDWDLWLRVARRYPIYSLNEFLVRYRFRTNSLSKSAPVMEKNLNYLLDKLIVAKPAGDSLDEKMVCKITRHYRNQMASLWKDSAYVYLFDQGDGKKFRSYIRQGFRNDRSLFGLKVLVYYLFSFVSVSFCRMMKRCKKKSLTKLFPDNVRDVKDLKF